MSDVEPLTDGELVQFSNMLLALKDEVRVSASYRNYRGETATRTITPKEIWHGSTDWHPLPGLMLKAFDHDKNAVRDFALADFNMKTWRAA